MSPKVKLVWTVGLVPTGPYRSFHKRSWPSARYGSRAGKLAATLVCEDSYDPARARAGNHAPIEVLVCHHQHKDAGLSWKIFVLKQRAKTLEEAKALAQDFIDKHPDWHPIEKGKSM